MESWSIPRQLNAFLPTSSSGGPPMEGVHNILGKAVKLQAFLRAKASTAQTEPSMDSPPSSQTPSASTCRPSTVVLAAVISEQALQVRT